MIGVPDHPMHYQQPMPHRVQAAFHYLEFIYRVEAYSSNGQCAPVGESWQSSGGRELTQQEQATRNQATEVVRLYLAGEMDYGDSPPIRHYPDDEGPQQRQPVTVT